MTRRIIFLEYCKKNKYQNKKKKKKKKRKNKTKKKQNKTKKKNEKTKQKKNEKKFDICKSSPRVPWREFLFLMMFNQEN